jgi:potassium efflux system protein
MKSVGALLRAATGCHRRFPASSQLFGLHRSSWLWVLIGLSQAVYAQDGTGFQPPPTNLLRPPLTAPGAGDPNLGNVPAFPSPPAGVPASPEASPPPTTEPAAATSQSGAGATADESDSSDAARLPTPEQLSALALNLAADTELEESLRQPLLDAVAAMQADLQSRVDLVKRVADRQGAIDAAPSVLAELRRLQQEPVARKSRLPAEGTGFLSLERLQELQRESETQWRSYEEERRRLEERIARRETRRRDIPQQLANEREQVAQLTAELAGLAGDTGPLLQRELRSWQLQIRRQLAEDRLRSLEVELRQIEAEAEVLPLKRESALADERFWQSEFNRATELLRGRQDFILRQRRREMEQMVERLPPELQSSGQALVDRLSSWQEIARAQAEVQQKISQARSQLDVLERRYQTMVDRLDSIGSGFTSLLNSMLRQQRLELQSDPEWDAYALRSQIRSYQRQMREVEATLLDVSLRQSQLSSKIDSGSSPEPYTEQDLWIQENRLLTEFQVQANRYFNDLFELATIKQNKFSLLRQYMDLIDKHILWARSTDLFGWNDIKLSREALEWLLRYSHVQALTDLLAQDLRGYPWVWLVLALLIALLLWAGTRMRRHIANLGQRVNRTNYLEYLPTPITLLLSLLLALPLPLLCLAFAWRLSSVPEGDSGFLSGLSQGLGRIAFFIYPLEALRQICRPLGLAERHFGWAEDNTRLLRNWIKLLIRAASPLVLVVAVLYGAGQEAFGNSLGRMLFIVMMLLLAFVGYRLLHPQHGILTAYLNQYPGGWLDRLRYVWFGLLLFVPLGLALLSLGGFHYTARRLAIANFQSLALLLGLYVAYRMAKRYLLLNRRRILRAQARARLEESMREDPSAGDALPIVETEVDLAEVNAQTMRLLNSLTLVGAALALYVSWASLLPAAAALNEIRIWPIGAAGANIENPLTLQMLLLAVPVFFLTFAAARNIPGLLEVTLLQNLPLDNATRYAIASLSRYAILLIGLLMTSQLLGLRWDNVQWLVAALGVGLGFGLQEIFGNFVSGIILLFEQPIRVGDVITLGGTTGKVAKIRMRATTVVNWDRQELIIPNKELITGQLLNWTLSDNSTRLVINVRVAYGTDTEQACQMIRDICQANPNVLADPAPRVVFEKFGASSLDLLCLCFVSTLDVRLQTLHELQTAIHNRFQSSGIEIPFPQRDLHVRSWPTAWPAAGGWGSLAPAGPLAGTPRTEGTTSIPNEGRMPPPSSGLPGSERAEPEGGRGWADR